MISAGDFRNGITFEQDGNIFQIIEFQHVKPGKGSAFVRTKIKNIISGSVIERTYNPNEKFEKAHILTKEMQYLYTDSDLFYFMDLNSFEQIPIEKEKIGDSLDFVKENTNVKIMSHKDNIFAVEPPNFVDLKIIHTEPAVRGNTATNATKPATVETGVIVYVPMFIEKDEIIKIDTRNHKYVERA
ncbi:MAG: elongation factor P [Clostridiales bacterium]|jgi:elongation factor P|nr:elongation factor P [Clostridiales bacterium]